MSRVIPCCAVFAAASAHLAPRAFAQTPDSAYRLRDQVVSVSRTPGSLTSLGASITVVDSASVRRQRLATGLDETLAFVPGVVTGNRHNYSVDQRLSIRGFGARANFGLRGVKVLLDGVPQTLPDGQSQLTNLDLALIDRVEVLRGGASAQFGNASGGVVAFTSRVIPATPWSVTARGETGAFETSRVQALLGARTSTAGGTVAVSRFSTDGSRQHSAAEQRRINAGGDWSPSGRTTISLRAAYADDPEAQNPGALTDVEYRARRDSAAAANIRRDADKSVQQTQISLGVHHEARNLRIEATTWGLTRTLRNPLATPPPAPVTADAGTYVDIDRVDGGLRTAATWQYRRVVATAGFDTQLLRDDRQNHRSKAGMRSDTTLLDQRETVTEFGPFLQAAVSASSAVTIHAGIRHDATRFDVDDHFLVDGNASGARTLGAWSANARTAVAFTNRASAWIGVSTVFETPTTTELANRPAGDGGFNNDLDPQRSVSGEIGVRTLVGALQLELAAYSTGTRDAIIPFREVNGRTFFRNAGRTRTRGTEATFRYALSSGMALLATWTFTDAIFTDYHVTDGTNTDVLDGHDLAGLPHHVAHVGVQGSMGHGFSVDADIARTSSQYADDDNTIRVPGWTTASARVGWRGNIGSLSVAPFAVVQNVFDRAYVGSVSTNGAAGRVLEPAARRALYFGAELTAAAR